MSFICKLLFITFSFSCLASKSQSKCNEIYTDFSRTSPQDSLYSKVVAQWIEKHMPSSVKTTRLRMGCHWYLCEAVKIHFSFSVDAAGKPVNIRDLTIYRCKPGEFTRKKKKLQRSFEKLVFPVSCRNKCYDFNYNQIMKC